MKDALYKTLVLIFLVTLVSFMLIGVCLVLCQLFGIAIGNASLVLNVNKMLKPCSIWIASVCGFAGFFASYLKPSKKL